VYLCIYLSISMHLSPSICLSIPISIYSSSAMARVTCRRVAVAACCVAPPWRTCSRKGVICVSIYLSLSIYLYPSIYERDGACELPARRRGCVLGGTTVPDLYTQGGCMYVCISISIHLFLSIYICLSIARARGRA